MNKINVKITLPHDMDIDTNLLLKCTEVIIRNCEKTVWNTDYGFEDYIDVNFYD